MERPNGPGVWWDKLSGVFVLACFRPVSEGEGYVRKLFVWTLDDDGCESLGPAENILTGEWLSVKELIGKALR